MGWTPDTICEWFRTHHWKTKPPKDLVSAIAVIADQPKGTNRLIEAAVTRKATDNDKNVLDLVLPYLDGHFTTLELLEYILDDQVFQRILVFCPIDIRRTWRRLVKYIADEASIPDDCASIIIKRIMTII